AASAAWGDYDNDGDPDLFVTHGVPANGLYRNEQGSFARVPSTVAIAASEANGTAWADFDNDGWLDLLVVQRNGAHLLYRGIGAGEFEPVVSAAIVTDEFPANGMALADYDL